MVSRWIVVAACVFAACAPEAPPPSVTPQPQPPPPGPATPPPSAPAAPPAPGFDATFDAMRETWPSRVCALQSSGVPSIVRFDVCNCGEPLECRARQRNGGGVETWVREGQVAAACDECVGGSATCPILWSLAPRHDVLHVNGRVEVPVETTEIGLLEVGRCWAVPRPESP